MTSQPEAPAETGPAPSDADVIAERRTPAYTAVREYIRQHPGLEATTVSIIWRALELGLDAMRVGQCDSSHCVEGDHVLIVKPAGEAPDWTLDEPAEPPLLNQILADAAHHTACAARSAEKNPDIPELAASHDGMAAGLYIAGTHIARGNPALLARLKQQIDQPQQEPVIRKLAAWVPACPTGRHTAHPGYTCEEADAAADHWAEVCNQAARVFDAQTTDVPAALRGPNWKARP